MSVVVCSMFRNSASYLERYFDQMDKLDAEVPLHLVLAEGDHTDDTRERLWDYVGRAQILRVDHGGADHGSVDHPDRWANIATVVRVLVNAAFIYQPTLLVWVESDLIWDTADILRLIEAAKAGRAVAPRVLIEGSTRWYDTWGYRSNGAQFDASPPYCPIPPDDQGYVKIDSCGSCFVAPPNLVEGWDGHWPFTADGQLWLDTGATVRHPQ